MCTLIVRLNFGNHTNERNKSECQAFDFKMLIRDRINVRVVVKILANGTKKPGFEPNGITIAATIS